MAKLWQLRDLQTNENLTELQPLPKNWNGIFGMENIKDRLGDLSWKGMPGKGWVEVEVVDETEDQKRTNIIKNQIEHLLKESDWKVASDNTSISKGERALWIEYRGKLRDLLQLGFQPDNVPWPARPE